MNAPLAFTVLIERVDINDDGALAEQLVLKPKTIRIEFRAQRSGGSLNPTPIVTNIECN